MDNNERNEKLKELCEEKEKVTADEYISFIGAGACSIASGISYAVEVSKGMDGFGGGTIALVYVTGLAALLGILYDLVRRKLRKEIRELNNKDKIDLKKALESETGVNEEVHKEPEDTVIKK